MRYRLVLLLFLSSAAFCQVTLISPEEGKRALKNLPPQPAKPATAAPATPASRAKPAGILPDSFNGWAGVSKQVFGPYSAATLAGDLAPFLVEYGYVGGERRQFQKDHQTLAVDALRMKDSSGSYGFFTFSRGEGWTTSEAGQGQIARQRRELLARKGDVVIRASLPEGSRIPQLSDDDVHELLAQLGTQGGGPLPTLPQHLPARGLVRNSSTYIMGPAVFDRLVKNFPSVLIDFDMGAEAELARYEPPGSAPVKLLLLSYPTPQMAAAKLKEWKQTPPIPGDAAGPLYSRRAGPLLAFVLGGSQSEADGLLSSVSYEAQVTWNQRVERPDDALTFARLILNIFLLIGVLLLFALAAGLGFGLLRVVLQRRYPNRFFDRLEETEIIQLNINYSPRRT